MSSAVTAGIALLVGGHIIRRKNCDEINTHEREKQGDIGRVRGE